MFHKYVYSHISLRFCLIDMGFGLKSHLTFDLDIVVIVQGQTSIFKHDVERPLFCWKDLLIFFCFLLLGLSSFLLERPTPVSKTYWYYNVSYSLFFILPSRVSGVTSRYLAKTFDLLTRGEIDTTWPLKGFSYLPFNAKSRKPCYPYYFLAVRFNNLKLVSMWCGRISNSKPKNQIWARGRN